MKGNAFGEHLTWQCRQEQVPSVYYGSAVFIDLSNASLVHTPLKRP